MCLSFMQQNDTGSCIPEDLKARLNQVKMKGNLQQIETFFNQLAEREKMNSQTLQSVEQLLNMERNQDLDLRNRGVNMHGRIESGMAAKHYNEAVAK